MTILINFQNLLTPQLPDTLRIVIFQRIDIYFFLFTAYGPMSPHPGYGMSGVQAEYPGNTYTPYPTAGYNCGGAYPGGPVTSGYQIPAGYTPAPCYSMPPPQHTIGGLDKPSGKDDG